MLIALIAPTLAFASTSLVNESPGTIITFSGKQWMVLSHMPDGSTYIILNSNNGNRAFDPDNTQLFCNSSDTNNIGWYLNNTFYNSLSQKDLIKTHSWGIKFENGTGGQSNVNANIGLLSYGEYQTYRGNPLPQSGSGYWWWLRTPLSGYPSHVWGVSATGSLSLNHASNSSGGVRPALYLKSGILVSGTKEVIGVGEPDPPPVAPTGLGISSITQILATASWNAVAGATEYKVYLNGSLNATTSSTTRELTGLEPGIEYQLEVSAVGPGGEGQKASINFTTLPPPPPAPAEVTVSNISSISAQISWPVVTGANEYNIYLSGQYVTTTVNTNGALNGLEPDIQYTVEVSAIGPGGESAKASTVFATLPPDPPAQPTGLIVSDVTQNNAIINWNAVIGATEYKIYLNDDLIATTIATNGTLNGLSPDTQYSVQVSAVGPGGESGKTSAAFETLVAGIEPPSQPTGLNVSNITQDNALINWLSVDGATGYKIYLNSEYISTTASTNGTLSGLEPSTQYLVEVSATGPGGESPRTSATFETLDIEPPGQATLNASVSGGSVKFSWDAAGYVEKWELCSIDNGDYTLIEEFPGSTKSATLEMPNGDYSYAVRAYNSSGYGEYSATESFSINKVLYHDILDVFKMIGLFIKELWFLLALSLALIVLPRIIQIIKNTAAKRKQTI